MHTRFRMQAATTRLFFIHNSNRLRSRGNLMQEHEKTFLELVIMGAFIGIAKQRLTLKEMR